MKFRRDSTKGEMMTEQEIAEQAWAEGAEAVYRGNNLFDGVFPENPYALGPIIKVLPIIFPHLPSSLHENP
jgi:hypothetical protein